jgi:hypothetical protein
MDVNRSWLVPALFIAIIILMVVIWVMSPPLYPVR